jgi:hypothetical protein
MPLYAPIGKFGGADKTDETHYKIDALWELVNKHETNFLDSKELESLGVKLIFAPYSDSTSGEICFEPFYFMPFPPYKLDEYRISERQKTQGDDMAVENFEPEKDKRPAHYTLNRWDPIARGDRLIACLIIIQGLLHYTIFEDESNKGDKKELEPLITLTNLHKI